MNKLLTRDFIKHSLYNNKNGYFCKEENQIGRIDNPIDFKNLHGYNDYKDALFNVYPKNKWLTPSEIFRPYYGMTIAKYIYNYNIYHNISEYKFIEIGGGLGGLADGILLFFKNYYPSIYSEIEYNIFDYSESNLKKCKNILYKNNKKLIDNKRINFINTSIEDYNLYDKDSHYYFLLFEVLDNMPHDRVYLDNKLILNDCFQTSINYNEKNNYFEEIKEPISDNLIKELLNIYFLYLKQRNNNSKIRKDSFFEKVFSVEHWYKTYKKQIKDNIFLPTVSYKLIKDIVNKVQKHHFIMSDFRLLLESKSSLSGINAPIVSKKLESSTEKKDYDNYLIPFGEADIFFPTDFKFLLFYYNYIIKNTSIKGNILNNYDFMETFSNENWCNTKIGYNPLKEDFQNTSFFVSDDLDWLNN